MTPPARTMRYTADLDELEKLAREAKRTKAKFTMLPGPYLATITPDTVLSLVATARAVEGFRAWLVSAHDIVSLDAVLAELDRRLGGGE